MSCKWICLSFLILHALLLFSKDKSILISRVYVKEGITSKTWETDFFRHKRDGRKKEHSDKEKSAQENNAEKKVIEKNKKTTKRVQKKKEKSSLKKIEKKKHVTFEIQYPTVTQEDNTSWQAEPSIRVIEKDEKKRK